MILVHIFDSENGEYESDKFFENIKGRSDSYFLVDWQWAIDESMDYAEKNPERFGKAEFVAWNLTDAIEKLKERGWMNIKEPPGIIEVDVSY